MSKGKVVVGTLAGLAVGAIAGILLAPQKGSKTRKQIMDKSSDYYDELKAKFDEFTDSLAEKFENTKKEVENLAEKGKSKYDEMKKSV